MKITAGDASKTYGDPDPDLTASFDGLRNGDTKSVIDGLVLTGPPAGSGAGSYDIVASGASNPAYDITYVAGTMTVGKAPLTIRPDDRSRVYGAERPSYSAELDGLVDGDTASDITGLQIDGPKKAAEVGTYDIVASSADNPNYDYTYETGTETITAAPLTITADDVTRRYGAAADYTASFEGLVNGDRPGSVDGLGFAGASAGADVGDYPIALTGGENPNYDITLVDGIESVVPAPLTITADDRTRRYGASSPAYTARFRGLTNGDEKQDVQGLTIAGAPAGAGVGKYPISPGGAEDPNYDIEFVAGTETVTQAPLTVIADDKTKLYGAPHPTFTVRYDGLVNGDTKAAISGVEFDVAPAGSDVGSYRILPRHATNPNYDFHYVAGTESITRAPLTIRADDATVKYGATVTPTLDRHGLGERRRRQGDRHRTHVHGRRSHTWPAPRRDHVLRRGRPQLRHRLHRGDAHREPRDPPRPDRATRQPAAPGLHRLPVRDPADRRRGGRLRHRPRLRLPARGGRGQGRDLPHQDSRLHRAGRWQPHRDGLLPDDGKRAVGRGRRGRDDACGREVFACEMGQGQGGARE